MNPKLVRADLLWFILFNSCECKPRQKQFKSEFSVLRSKNVIKECECRVILQQLVVDHCVGDHIQLSDLKPGPPFSHLPSDLMGCWDSK